MYDEKHRLVKGNVSGKDARADLILTAEDPSLVDLYSKCLTLNKSPLKKSYIEASLICSEDLSDISSILEVPLPVLEVYKEFFFEVSGLGKLDKIEHIESVTDSQEKMLKLWALGQGLTFLEWRLGKKVQLSPIEGLTELYSTAMYKAKEAMYTDNTSESSKEAIKWTKLSADIARLLKVWVLDSSAAKADLNIAISEVIPDFVGIDSLLDDNRK